MSEPRLAERGDGDSGEDPEERWAHYQACGGYV
jgi:hypothetical protein